MQSDGSDFSFQQFDTELQQYIPLLRENWVLVFRGAASTTTTSTNNRVPYFMMPYLGSGETLRGFQNRRFRDRNSLLLQAEYRWTPAHLVDMALFTDTGKVAANSSDLNFDGLHTDYGIGIRFHAPKLTVFRIDLAHSNEGFNVVFSTGIF
jgi:outer membrane protein assembly factor BamA